MRAAAAQILSRTKKKLERQTVIMCDIEKQDAELKQKCQEKLRTVTDVMEKLRLSLLSRGSGSIIGIGRFVSYNNYTHTCILLSYRLPMSILKNNIFH